MTSTKNDFNFQKKLCLDKLYKPDRSRKGDVDEAIIPLIDYLNKLTNFYTKSSCSGRIYILTEAEKKQDVNWLFVSHEKINAKILKQIITQTLSKENLKKHKEMIWLRQENMIVHVACRTMEDANNLLKIARDIGLRRSGIIADSNIIIVEICSTEKMYIPLAEKGNLLVSENYIKLIIKIANSKFQKGRDKLNRLFENIKKELK